MLFIPSFTCTLSAISISTNTHFAALSAFIAALSAFSVGISSTLLVTSISRALSRGERRRETPRSADFAAESSSFRAAHCVRLFSSAAAFGSRW